MNPMKIIQKYYASESTAFDILRVHSEMVTEKALDLAARVPHLNPDMDFIREAAMLHDIGIFLTNAAGIGCHGEAPYLQHGVLGREILAKEGLPKHGLVCERHIGTGLTKAEIVRAGLPLPHRDMLPVTIEEKIICFADCFYGKNPRHLREEKSIENVVQSASKWGKESLHRLQEFRRIFNV